MLLYMHSLCVPVNEVAQRQRLRSSTYGDLCVPRTWRNRRLASIRCFRPIALEPVTGVTAATRATCTSTPDCSKGALKTSLFS